MFAAVTALLVGGQVAAGLTALAGTQPRPASLPARAVPKPAVPAGWRTVSFGGASVQVPASWPVVNLDLHPSACPRLDVHAVYLGTPGPAPHCPARLVGRTEAVQIQPGSQQDPAARQASRPVLVGGRRALTNANYRVTHVLVYQPSGAGPQVSVSYGDDRALAAQIAATISYAAGPPASPAPPATPGPSGRRTQQQGSIRRAARQGVFRGAGFDTCSAPAAGVLHRWLRSRYRAVGIYIGGMNRACAQPSLTPRWIAAIRAQGWHYFPIYVGRQASCVRGLRVVRIVAGDAAAEGRAAAHDAVTQARDLGIPRWTPVIYDMEAYTGCGREVAAFLSAWDAALHSEGYLAGVYESFSNVADLLRRARSMTEPDVMHYADWDFHGTTTSSYMPRHRWTRHSRIHQFRGPHREAYGGFALDIDNDRLNVRLGPAAPSR